MSTAADELEQGSPQNASEAEIREAFHKQQARALELRKSTLEERIEKIRRLRDAVLARREELQRAGAADYRKPSVEVDLTEIFPILTEVKHTIKHLRKWARPRKVRATLPLFGTRSEIRYEPKGVSLIISPWNYPVNLTFCPLVSALAAGCTAILKPSEMTPNLSRVMVEIVRETFDERDVAIFEGDAQVASTLLDLPFDHIFFTGSPAVGRIVMAAAAKHLSSVTLELGGKSPTIVDRSANIRKAARNVVWGKFTNNGQTCIAHDLLYVESGVKNAFVAEATQALHEVFGATTEEQKRSPDYCRIVNNRHFERISGLLDDARERGARTLVGGDTDAGENFIAPTLLEGVDKDAGIMQEEIFGPILPVIAFDDLDTVIADINSRPKPLALYVYGKDNDRIEKILRETSAGGTCINHSMVHYMHNNLPFGGVNNSGIGASHGIYGFREFSHARAVLRDRFSTSSQLYPPYNDKVKKQVNMALRLFRK
ncbi:MAG TPA: aldehyde dehydrogenase family protein [Gammaproteobacteria bacterium]|nr:aldehyde dehydrogenase family protein [Gammaproteobacteria bacterium]